MRAFKCLLPVVFLTCLSGFSYGQQPGKIPADSLKEPGLKAEPADGIYSSAEKMPAFPGGEEAMMKFMSDNFTFPLQERSRTIEGNVTVQFIVTAEGKIKSPQIVQSLSAGIDAEVLRVISIMPQWQPGLQKGKKVSVRYVLVYTVKSQG
jgi:TonB family protein